MPGWMNQKLDKVARRNINNLRYINDTILMVESEEELKEVGEENEKTGLKFKIQKARIRLSGPITSRQIEGKKVKTVTDSIFFFFFLLQKPHLKTLKRHLLLERKKTMTILDSITLLTKVHIVKDTVFLVVMYRCESWPIKKAECRTDAFELWICYSITYMEICYCICVHISYPRLWCLQKSVLVKHFF